MPPKSTSGHRPANRSFNSTEQKSIPVLSSTANSPVHLDQPENSEKNLINQLGVVNSDSNCNTVSDSVDIKITAELKKMYDFPKNSSNLEGETVRGTDGSNCAGNSSSGSLIGSNSGKKRTIVRKTVRLVKKVIKRRVPKKPLLNNSENRGEFVKKEDNGVVLMEVAENSNIVNGEIEDSKMVGKEDTKKYNLVGETSNQNIDTGELEPISVEKGNDFSGIFFMEMDNLMSNGVMAGVDKRENTSVSDPIEGEKFLVDEKIDDLETGQALNSNILDGAIEDSNIVGEEDTEKYDLLDETLNQNIDSGELEPIFVEKSNDFRGFVSLEIDNLTSNGVMTGIDRRQDTSISNSIEDEKFYADERINDLETGHLLIENVVMDSVKNEDFGLIGNNEGEEKVNEEASSKCDLVNEVVLLSGELEALERKKRRKTEVFVRGLSQDTTEDDVRKVFENVGAVVEARLVMDTKRRGRHRGFAFVRFAEADDAKKALLKHAKVEICGKQCTTEAVEGNDTLYLGNIDRKWKTEDVLKLLEKAGIEKIDEVTLKTDPNNIENNRGFAFLELETSKDAQIAFHKLQKKGAFGKNTNIKIDWAQPLSEPSEEEILKVKSVYAEFLPSSWDEKKVKKYFKRFGEIENIALAKDLISSKRSDFAFINYTTREAAITCIDTISREGVEDNGAKVHITASLAKPIPKSKQIKPASNRTSKQLYKEKPKKSKAFKKLNERRNTGKIDSNSSISSSTTDELVQILRRQASNNQIPPRVSIGSSVPDHHFPLPGSKRQFSHLGHDRLYLETRELPRARLESSYPLPSFSDMSRGAGMASFPYRQHQESRFTSEPVRGRNIYPSHFQTSEQAPYYGNNNMYRRY